MEEFFGKNGRTMESRLISNTNYFSLTRPEIISRIPGSVSRVLDIGCGYGSLGSSLKATRSAIEYYGIDSEPSAAEHLKGIANGFWISNLNVFDWTQVGKYDCIVAADVLEHLVDPWSTVAHIKDHLTQDGVLIVSVPNIGNINIVGRLILRGEWKYEESGILDITHLRFFTRKSAIRMISEAGFEIESVGENLENLKGWRAFLTLPFRIFFPELFVVQYIFRAKIRDL